MQGKKQGKLGLLTLSVTFNYKKIKMKLIFNLQRLIIDSKLIVPIANNHNKML